MQSEALRLAHIFLLQEPETARLPQDFMKNGCDWIRTWLIADDTVVASILDLPQSKEAKSIVIKVRVPQLLDNPRFRQELEEKWLLFTYFSSNAAQNDWDSVEDIADVSEETIVYYSKNTVSDSTISVGGDFHIGDNKTKIINNVVVNPETKKPEVRCPNCKTPAIDDQKNIQEGTSSIEIVCHQCGNRYFEIDNLAQNVSKYLGLDFVEGRQFSHFIHAVDSDLRLGEYSRAYDRCEFEKTRYGNSAPIYEYCALTYFFATPIREIVHSSARKIIIYLEDARRHDPNSESYEPIAGMIAIRYSKAIRGHLELQRFTRPQKVLPPVPNPSSQEKKRLEEHYKQAWLNYRYEMLKFIKEYETCYKIFPYVDFLESAAKEICGHNGTPWLNIEFVSWFARPKSGIPYISGFVWDYYKIVNNTPDFNGDLERAPLVILERVYSKAKSHNSGYQLPEIKVGEATTERSVSISSKLVNRALIFWVIMLSLFVSGIAVREVPGYLLSGVILFGAALYFNEVKTNLKKLLKAMW